MKLASLALVMGSLLMLGGCGGGGDNKRDAVPASEQPTSSKPSLSGSIPFDAEGRVAWHDIGVHDPSIIKNGNHYYIFGSHLAAATSTDLLNWEYISVLSANDRVDESPLFNSYSTQIAEGIAWTDGFKGNWAADVIQAPNGKFWFYYNHCAQAEAEDGGCWNRSYLGLAEADAIDGPYINKGVFLRSGYRTPAEFAAYPLDNGQTTWDGQTDPNVIDPAAFFDKSGELWMVYGSYSGGIFMLAMDKNSGMPKPGQGYGTRLLGGDFRAIEGAYVLYSPVSDYYYLFYSVAGFAADEGYNIRIARSKTPQGPYFDPAGNNIADIDGLEIGGKLLGGFEFTHSLGDVGATWGYQSPGHNSAIYDAASKRHLLITHTRFPSTATAYPGNPEAHAVRSHEMFVNKESWLVVSPQRYVPLDGNNVVDAAHIPGHYQWVNQGRAVNTTAIQSGYLTLQSNRTVSGSEQGTWFPNGADSISLMLESGNYFGAVKWQWDNGLNALVPVITAMANDGSTVFGTRTHALSETAGALRDVAAALQIKRDMTVQDDGYVLPTVGSAGTTITWQSSNDYLISDKVFIPTPDIGNQTVSLTATLTLNGESTTKSFTVNLQARPAFKNAVAHYSFEDNLADGLQNFANAQPTDRDLNNTGFGNLSYTAGKSGKAVVLNGESGIRLPNDIIASSQFTVSFWSNSADLREHTPAFFAAKDADNWLSYIPGKAWFNNESLIWSFFGGINAADNGDWSQIIAGSTAPLNQWRHVAITYDAPVMKLFIDGSLAGQMNRADIFSGNNGFYAIGVNFGWDNPFKGQIDEFIVYDYALTALDINGAAINNLTDESQFASFVKNALELGDLSAVRENFDLIRVGPFVSGIQWTSSNEHFLKPSNGVAVVKQPTEEQGDQVVTLTAHISYQAVTETKDFEVTIKSLAPAEYSFDGDLTAINHAAEAGKITGNRMDNTGGSVSYVDGVKGLAVKLDGTSGIRLPNNLITTASYSISLWLKPEAFTDYSTAFFGGANANNWLSLVPSMAGTSKTRVWANSPFYDKAELANRIPANEWTHIVIVVDGENNDSIRLYANGQLQLDAAGFPRVMTVAGETNEFALGVNYWDTPYKGAIDELKVFTGTIQQEKITALYQEGLPTN